MNGTIHRIWCSFSAPQQLSLPSLWPHHELGASDTLVESGIAVETFSLGRPAGAYKFRPSSLSRPSSLPRGQADNLRRFGVPMIRSFLVATLVANMCAVSLASVTAADGGPGVVAPAGGESAKWTNDQKASYLIGQQMAKRLKPFAADLDTALLIKSIQDVFADKPSVVPASEEQAVMQAFQETMQGKEAKRAEGRVAENVKWLAANGKKDGVKTTVTGLQYQVMATGAGKQAAMGKTVKVHYTGTLLDGSVFDSSVARGEPADFPLNPGGLIQGWLEAIPMMKEGDKWKLFIPSELAYGERGNQGIAPNSVLIFEVELIKVSSGEAAAPDAGIEAVPLGK